MPDWSEKRKEVLTNCNLKQHSQQLSRPPSPPQQQLQQKTNTPFNTSNNTTQSTRITNSPQLEMEHQNNQEQNQATPMIVERVQKIPVVNFAVSVGLTQYDKLKSSHVTVGEVMTRAENLAFYFWQKFQPIVEKLPINKADKFVCNTIDYVEEKLSTIRNVTKHNAATAISASETPKVSVKISTSMIESASPSTNIIQVLKRQAQVSTVESPRVSLNPSALISGTSSSSNSNRAGNSAAASNIIIINNDNDELSSRQQLSTETRQQPYQSQQQQQQHHSQQPLLSPPTQHSKVQNSLSERKKQANSLTFAAEAPSPLQPTTLYAGGKILDNIQADGASHHRSVSRSSISFKPLSPSSPSFPPINSQILIPMKKTLNQESSEVGGSQEMTLDQQQQQSLGQARSWQEAINEREQQQQQQPRLFTTTTDEDYSCQRRSMGNMLKSAKEWLTGGFASMEQYARSGNILKLGSNLLFATVPIIPFIIPETRSRKRTNIAGAASPADSTNSRFSIQGRVDSIMGWIERSVEHLPNFPRLHPQECVKRSICEAHNEPTKFGAVGFMLRLLFPATNLSITDRMDNMEYKVINKYRHAAGYGLNKRIDNNGTGSSSVCKEKYEDCLVSLLEVAQNLLDIFLK